jgi:hypothetical protein
MVDHRRRDDWKRRSRLRSPDAGEEPEEERALLDLQEQAGNRAVTDAIAAVREGTAVPAPAPGASADSPGLRVLAALRAGPVAVQRQAAGGLLRRGMRGPEVEALQADLARAGYALVVDGIFGPATQAAVVAFQRSAGLAADGIVGPATRGALATGGKEAGKAAGTGGVEKEAWTPGEAEVAAKEVGAKEVAAKEGAAVEEKAWAPEGEEAAKNPGVEKEAWAPEVEEEVEAKKGSAVDKEAWTPEEEEAAHKVEGAKEGEVEKEESWLT